MREKKDIEINVENKLNICRFKSISSFLGDSYNSLGILLEHPQVLHCNFGHRPKEKESALLRQRSRTTQKVNSQSLLPGRFVLTTEIENLTFDFSVLTETAVVVLFYYPQGPFNVYNVLSVIDLQRGVVNRTGITD